MVLDEACKLTEDPVVRFAALTHDLGKGTTPPDEWPRHVMHEHRGVELIHKLCDRLRIPNAYRELAVSVSRYHLNAHKALELRPKTLLELCESLDGFRRPERFEGFVLACEADARGRKGLENRDYPQSNFLRRAREVAASVKPDETFAGLTGEQIGERLRKLRISALSDLKAHVSD
jgi:tRNA nucleotidyltransferase (CCA-adding enzyme)